jgi:cytolysin-activating lysine-acyltransferase
LHTCSTVHKQVPLAAQKSEKVLLDAVFRTALTWLTEQKNAKWASVFLVSLTLRDAIMVTATPTSQPDPATPEAQKAAADMRAATFGRLMAMLLASPQHAGMTLAQTNAYIMPAIALGQFAMVGAHQTEKGPMSIAAAAWWALVSPEIDQRLSDSRDPHLSLQAADWNSGDQPWIIEAFGEPKLLNSLLGRLSEQKFKGKTAKLRAHLADGRIAVGRLEPNPAETSSPTGPTKA